MISQEIIAFQDAVSKKDIAEAKRIIEFAKNVSESTKVSWRYKVEYIESRGEIDLNRLLMDIKKNEFHLSLVYLYFEICLEKKDTKSFDKLWLIFDLNRYDMDSPKYFRAIHSYLHGLQAKASDKQIAKLLHTKRDPNFMKYISQ